MEKTKPKIGSVQQKRKAQVTVSEPKNVKLAPSSPKKARIETPTKLKSQKKVKKPKTQISHSEKIVNLNTQEKAINDVSVIKATDKKQVDKKNKIDTIIEGTEKYTVLKDKELIHKFMKVPLTNNQKGRIRQALKAQLQSSDATLFPDIINGKIQAILKSSENLTDSDLKRIRILHNMLKTSLEKTKFLKRPSGGQGSPTSPAMSRGSKPPPINLAESDRDNTNDLVTDLEITDQPELQNEETVKKNRKNKKDKKNNEKDVREQLVQRVKGPKRYVVFLGNLPLDINKDGIMNHFAELNEQIKDIRIQKPKEGKKKAFAYVELSNEPSFELALSKHHSMMGSNRINVLYTTQQNTKVTKAEAKSKTAKLIALQKTGKLVGSLPISKKRSHRRMILKNARAQAQAEAEANFSRT